MKKQDNLSRHQKFLLVLLISMVLASVLGILWMAQDKPPSLFATLTIGGVVLERIDLSNVTTPYEFWVEEVEGQKNLISVKVGEIGVAEANCPDGLCIAQGFSSGTGRPIVCLPHRLVIDFSENEGTLDGYTG